jgi:alkylated DNA repair protein alkB family protein 7
MSSSTARPAASFVDARNAPHDFDPASVVVYKDFVTKTEGESLVHDIMARMKRRRYEKGHWDAVITDYKEVELLNAESLQEESKNVMKRVRDQLIAARHVDCNVTWLPCHAIDLKRDGELKAHVDSVKFSGGVVAGISLLSSSIMRLKPDGEPNGGWVDMYLPPLSLYVLSSVSRYRYSHELLPCGSIFERPGGTTISVQRDQRLSVIFRDAKQDNP